MNRNFEPIFVNHSCLFFEEVNFKILCRFQWLICFHLGSWDLLCVCEYYAFDTCFVIINSSFLNTFFNMLHGLIFCAEILASGISLSSILFFFYLFGFLANKLLSRQMLSKLFFFPGSNFTFHMLSYFLCHFVLCFAYGVRLGPLSSTYKQYIHMIYINDPNNIY